MLDMNAAVDFSDLSVRRFLLDANSPTLVLQPQIAPNYNHDENDVRPSGNPRVNAQTVPYLVEESWQLLQDGTRTGIQRVVVGYEQDIDISVDYWLLLTELSAQQSLYCRQKFNEYDPAENGSDIQKWISGQLGEVVRDTDFKIDTCVTLTKTADPVAVNTLQRDALFKVYGANNGSQAYGLFEFNRDYGLNRWGDEHQVSWVQVGTDLPSSDKPKLNPNVAREVANLADVDQIIDGIVSAIIPGDCGRMTSHSQKLLTLGNWPEFMVEWVPAHIKVGCSEIVISLPVIRTRISSLNFYFYYSVPSNTGSFVIRICATCGERAALTGAILGLISTQIELAVPTFVELFTRCAESEIKRCVDPGLLLLIESDGPWR